MHVASDERGEHAPHESNTRPEGRFELYSWIFMRISGALLWILVLGHLLFVHIITDVSQIDFDFVAARWSTAFWQIWDWSMLILALVHGMNGIRIVAEDYLQARRWRVFSLIMIYLVSIAFLLIGSLTILVFKAPLA